MDIKTEEVSSGTFLYISASNEISEYRIYTPTIIHSYKGYVFLIGHYNYNAIISAEWFKSNKAHIDLITDELLLLIS